MRRNDHVVAAPEPDELLLLLKTLRSIQECAVANPEAQLRLLAGEDNLAARKQFRKVRGEFGAHIASCIYFRNVSGIVNMMMLFTD